MPTIGAMFGHSVPTSTPQKHKDVVGTTRVGVEVELEGMGGDHTGVSGWRIVPDGSLRNDGVEFVFNGGAGGHAIVNRLNSLEKYLKPRNPICSHRTSVHVHVDVRDMEWSDLWKMLVLYTIVEPYLFHHAGEGRDDNIYCLPFNKSDSQVEAVASIRNPQLARDRLGSSRFSKYSALNLLTLHTFGTVEFRGMGGTTDTNQILLMINLLLSLREFVRYCDDEVETWPRLVSTIGVHEFLSRVFGPLLAQTLPEEVEDAVMSGVFLAEDALHSSSISGVARQLEGLDDTSKAFQVLLKKYNPQPLKPSGPWRVVVTADGQYANHRSDDTVSIKEYAKRRVSTSRLRDFQSTQQLVDYLRDAGVMVYTPSETPHLNPIGTRERGDI